MELRLEVTQGPDRGKVLVFERSGPFVFGRAGPPDRDLQVLTDASVSRKHVLFDLGGDTVRLAPFAPHTTVWVAGQQVGGATLLPGQRVQIGRTILKPTWISKVATADDTAPAPVPVPTSLPRRSIESYELLDEIGRGAFGRVYEARDKDTDEHVALKVFDPSAEAVRGAEVELKEKALQLFLREMDVVAELRHPHIVRARALGRDGSRVFLAMELINGPTLEEVVSMSGPMAVADVGDVARQILAALGYAHDRDVVHRDVSAGNVILTGEAGGFTARLLDFGFAKSLGETTSHALTATGDVRGNLGFIAPECLVDAKHAGPQADLFSLAATVVFALTGRFWFGREVNARAIDAILEGQVMPVDADRPEVGADLTGWIKRSLARLPSDRWPGAQAMDAALAQAIR